MDKFKTKDIVSLTLIILISTYINYVAFIQKSDNWTSYLIFFLIELLLVIFTFIILYDVVTIEDKQKIELINFDKIRKNIKDTNKLL